MKRDDDKLLERAAPARWNALVESVGVSWQASRPCHGLNRHMLDKRGRGKCSLIVIKRKRGILTSFRTVSVLLSMANVNNQSDRQERVLQAASHRPKPTVFVISPPPGSAMARVKQRYPKENRAPANRAIKPSPSKVKTSLKFGFDYDPVNYDETLSVTESLKGLALSLNVEESDFPNESEHPVRKTVSELIKRIAHLNQLVQDFMHENSSLKNDIAAHANNEMSLQIEIEHLSETIHTLTNRLDSVEKEQKLAERKAKSSYTSLKKKFNAIRFRDKQYNNELRKRELECQKVQRKLRSVMASSRTGAENPSLRSSFQKLPTVKPSSSDLHKEVILLREDKQRIDKRWRAIYEENLRMRNLFTLIVSTMQSTVSADHGIQSSVLELPLEISGDQLEVMIAGLAETIRGSLHLDTTQNVADGQPHEDQTATIKDLKQIIKKQEELIRRAIFKEPEISPKCNRCDKIEQISPVK